MTMRFSILMLVVLTMADTARAEIIESSASHYVLRHEATSTHSPQALWQRLIEPATWWHPDHTYSGDAANLSLDLKAGGLWLEEWADGSVAHGEVLLVQRGEVLRMAAPFGPLQAVGAYTVWTITISVAEGGSMVVFDEISTAPASANLAELAGAVDYVKSEAISRLVAE